MRTIILCLIAAAAAIYLVVRATAPIAMHGNARPGETDGAHPLNTSSSASIVSVPHPAAPQGGK